MKIFNKMAFREQKLPMQVEPKKIYSAPKKFIFCLFNWNKKCDLLPGFGTKISEINQCPFMMRNLTCVNCEPILTAEDFEYKYPKTDQRSKKRSYISQRSEPDNDNIKIPVSKLSDRPVSDRQDLDTDTVNRTVQNQSLIKQTHYVYDNKREIEIEKIQIPSALVKLVYDNQMLELKTPNGHYRIHLDEIKMQLIENYPIAPKTINEILEKFTNKVKKPDTFTYQSVLYQHQVYALCKDFTKVIFVISAETKIENLDNKNISVTQEIKIPLK
jgi:hypothetical protein